MKKLLPIKEVPLKERIKAKKVEIRNIVKVMANKPSYARLAELNKQLSEKLRELNRLEVRASVAI